MYRNPDPAQKSPSPLSVDATRVRVCAGLAEISIKLPSGHSSYTSNGCAQIRAWRIINFTWKSPAHHELAQGSPYLNPVRLNFVDNPITPATFYCRVLFKRTRGRAFQQAKWREPGPVHRARPHARGGDGRDSPPPSEEAKSSARSELRRVLLTTAISTATFEFLCDMNATTPTLCCHVWELSFKGMWQSRYDEPRGVQSNK